MSRSRRLLAVALPLTLVFYQSLAFGQSDADKATARTLGTEAQTALDAKDYKTAEDKFRRADSIFHAPTLLLGLARAQAGLGRVVAAQESYSRIIREGAPAGGPAAFAKAVEDAKKEVDVVSARIGGVIINVTGAEAPKVTVDDTLIPPGALGVKRPIDPGSHTLKVTADGYKPAGKMFDVPEGSAKPPTVVDIAMEKDPNAVAAVVPPGPTGPNGTGTTAQTGTGTGTGTGSAALAPGADTGGGSSTKTIGYVALGVGAIGLVAGGITGVLAMSKHSDLEGKCPNGTCSDGAKVKQSDIDSYHTMGTISTIGFIVAGVGAVAGTVLILTAPKDHTTAKSKPWISPYVGVGNVGALGQF